MASRYLVVSLPVQGSASSIWTKLQQQISKHSFETLLYRFNIPNLRVGTLDSLLPLCDDLLKSNTFMEATSNKIKRQIEELEKASGDASGALSVDGVPVDSYLTRFVWDEAKYPTMSPLREIVDSIHSQVAKIEDDLKVRVAEYNNVRGQLNAINRKQSGRSSKMLYEYALYTVTLFSRVADNFRTRAREKGFQIRDFEYSPKCLLFLKDYANSSYWKSEDSVGAGMAGLGSDIDAHPYVTFTINLA